MKPLHLARVILSGPVILSGAKDLSLVVALALSVLVSCKPPAQQPPAKQKAQNDDATTVDTSDYSSDPSAGLDSPSDYGDDDKDKKKKSKKKKKDDDGDEEDEEDEDDSKDYDCERVTKKVRDCMEEEESLFDFADNSCSDVPIASWDCTRSEIKDQLRELNLPTDLPKGDPLACGEKEEGDQKFIIIQLCNETSIHTECAIGLTAEAAAEIEEKKDEGIFGGLFNLLAGDDEEDPKPEDEDPKPDDEDPPADGDEDFVTNSSRNCF